jgi:argininosuccinate synthase
MSVSYTGPYKKGDIKKVVLAYSGGLDTSVILKWLQTAYGCEVVTFTADLGQGEELSPARKKAEMLGIKPENIFIDDVREKIVLSYSGGLDTSIMLKWLQEHYQAEIITFTADLGQGEELEPARRKAEMFGIKDIRIVDVREEFVRDFVFPMFRANALYEGQYLLGTSIARPLIAKRQIELARKTGADAVAHGATGKGNDQVRFELTYYALKPDIKVIAPWREWELTSRTKLIEFAEKHQIPIARDKRGEAPFSVDANLLHSSSEGKILEDPWEEADEMVYQRTISPEKAPDKATYITVDFEKGDPVAVDDEKMSPATLLTRLNELGRANGIGRLDLVENRFVGMKSRGIYETPGGTILYAAHRGIESITLDRGAAHLKDELMPKYAELVYYGFWYSPEREMLQALIDKSQENVTGTVRLKLYKGNTTVVGRKSPKSLYSMQHVTFEDDQGAYNQRDAEGFIKLNALRLRLRAIGQGGAKS